MADSPPSAHVVHTLRGRVRLRVPAARGDQTVIDRIGLALANDRSVREVRVSARTGSVLLVHDGDLDALLGRATRDGILVVEREMPRAPMSRILSAIQEADARLASQTQGAMGLGTVTMFAMLAASVYQTRQGHFLPAGMTLLKYALGAVQSEAAREQSALRGRS